jgi:hypothetical protein
MRFAKISGVKAPFELLRMCIQVYLLLFPATFPTSPATTEAYSSLTVKLLACSPWAKNSRLNILTAPGPGRV